MIIIGGETITYQSNSESQKLNVKEKKLAHHHSEIMIEIDNDSSLSENVSLRL
jgi:hypothetical protein